MNLYNDWDSHEFLSNDNFIKSRAFYQFAWRINIENFEERYSKRKVEQPDKEDSFIQNEIKE